MTDIERLSAMRCDKQTSNLKTKPIDLLRAAAHDIETGRVKCDSLLILFAHCPDSVDEAWELNAHRAGLTRDREVVLLTLSLERTIRQWREEGEGD